MLLFTCDTPINNNEVLVINIPEKSMQQLTGFAEKALEQGVITNDLKKYVNATIVVNETTIPVELRLKGDWTDHLTTDQWSFRIKILNKGNYEGFKIFSIMNPKTRDYVDEWFMHEMLKGEGVLTTRYDFVPVMVNGEEKGVYAIEEHFTKELLSANDREDGPILKIAEDGYWEVTNQGKMDSISYSSHLPIYDACVIEPFQKNRILRSPSLTQKFYEGQALLFKHKNGSQPIDSLVLLDKYAIFYALGDLGKILHGMETHNRRWYYDSEVKRLEPIAYDICVPGKFTDEHRRPLFGFQEQHVKNINGKRKIIPFAPFNSSSFNEKYYRYLVQFSKRTYLDSIFNTLDEDLRKREKLLQENDSTYTFNRDFYYHNSERILVALERFRDLKYRTPPLYNLGPFPVSDTIFNLPPFTFVSLNAYYDNSDSTLAMENYYFSPIQIVGYIDSDDNRHDCDTIYLNKYQDGQSITWSTEIIDPVKLIFIAKNWDNLYSAEVMQWRHPDVSNEP
ncbi:MAG TPA: hypothetical protein EYN41_04200 [Flavobacteriales bacterium]|nr:hypothetical protein [Flavobacteriales bacterium]